MKKLLVVTVLAFTLFSCSEKNIYDVQIKNDYWHEYIDTEIIYEDGTIINLGVLIVIKNIDKLTQI